MDSPKSHQALKRGEKKESRRRSSHDNKKFYNSKAWRDTREAYLRHYRTKLYNTIKWGYWQGVPIDLEHVINFGTSDVRKDGPHNGPEAKLNSIEATSRLRVGTLDNPK